jgi:hypothetical protein
MSAEHEVHAVRAGVVLLWPVVVVVQARVLRDELEAVERSQAVLQESQAGHSNAAEQLAARQVQVRTAEAEVAIKVWAMGFVTP